MKIIWESHYTEKYTGRATSWEHNSWREWALIRVPVSLKH